MNINKFFNKYYWEDVWYRIDCAICPRNQWARDAVSKFWEDKDTVFRNVLYAGLVNFVSKEGEDCFGRTVWSDTKEHRAAAKKIKEIHKWITIGRPAKLKQLDAAFPKMPKNGDILGWINDDKYSYKEKYGKVESIESFIEKRDTEYLVWIVSNRGILWT